MRVFFLLNVLAVFSLGNAPAQTLPKPELSAAPLFRPNQVRTGTPLDTTGWRFTVRPVAEAVDDKSGEVRFKIVINKEGTIESVLPVSSTVSARQESLCRQALLQARFEQVGTKPGGATGYYTFKFTIN
ncbi:energy transducer TonB [Hymenobacter ruber]